MWCWQRIRTASANDSVALLEHVSKIHSNWRRAINGCVLLGIGGSGQW